MDLIFLLLLGVMVGFISAFFGVGGGIVMVPLLNIFFPELDQQFIIATSLSVIFINSMVNTYNFKKAVTLEIKTILSIALASVLTAYYTANYAKNISSDLLKWIFVIFLMITIVLLLTDRKPAPTHKTVSSTIKRLYQIFIGIIAGFISAITGLGGGAIIVPLMLFLLRTDIKSVSAYSNAIMIFTTCSGMLSYIISSAPTVSYYSMGYVLPSIGVFIILGSFFGSRFGVSLNQKVNQKSIKRYFALLLLAAVIRTVYGLL